MKILFIVDFNHFLLDSLYSRLREKNIQVKQLTLSGTVNNTNVVYGVTRKLKKLINMAYIILYAMFNSRKYDSISYHYATRTMHYIDWLIQPFFKRRVLTIWGSEFLCCNNKSKKRNINFYKKLDAISVTNPALIHTLNSENVNVINLSFGLSILDTIKKLRKNLDFKLIKQELGIDIEKKVIVVGTNASKGQQHLKIIHQLESIDEILAQDYQIVFPLTYGNEEVKKDISKALKNFKTENKLFFDVLSEEDIAKLRLISDILIQLQETDQLSGAMLETLYAGGYVITGSWLPYGILDEYGIKWSRINSIEKLAKLILNIIQNNPIEYSKHNQEIINKHYSWLAVINEWIKFLKREKC